THPPSDRAGAAAPAARQLPMSLVIDPPESLALMQEEIFGPILPVKAYDSIDEAVEYVNAGERPLAGVHILHSFVDRVVRLDGEDRSEDLLLHQGEALGRVDDERHRQLTRGGGGCAGAIGRGVG